MTVNAKSRRQFTLLTLVAALGVAVYLNWEYAKSDALLPDDVQAAAADSGVSVSAGVEQETGALTDPLATDTASSEGNKNYGDAQLVSIGQKSSDQYFDEARLSREKSRDEALDTLEKSLKKANLSEEEKAELTARLSGVVESITAESDIENLVKAKGFVDCVAFVDDGKVNVTVQTPGEGLDQEQVAQIRDVVLSRCEVKAQDITVVEVG
ncbi:MAG TPA: SpoIIIAH-like family protein [Candidatus Anaerofilum excrementigallinarum]|nr:SpoIIIAH-like family protein [Candidatus Anaerofilum excrementigallinarum]